MYRPVPDRRLGHRADGGTGQDGGTQAGRVVPGEDDDDDDDNDSDSKNDNDGSFQEEDNCTDNWEAWEPDPVDADPTKTSSGRRSSDIISMLVNIYGSKELFVNEYRSLLSNRLLANCSYDTEKEIRYLELLKLRFINIKKII